MRLRFVPGHSDVPGDMWLNPCGGPPHCPWENCNGQHLYVVLPNGHYWDVDSRASNCTAPADRKHRCWVRHGDPAGGVVTVDKVGETCAAGAGSIWSGDYHGMLTGGVFYPPGIGTPSAAPAPPDPRDTPDPSRCFACGYAEPPFTPAVALRGGQAQPCVLCVVCNRKVRSEGIRLASPRGHEIA